ncbi:hypothetical protein [Actinorugispora endophytica]|uniref:Uncharacterized protein n=1 Tax=Actinorugispora endophytica TaxID=1605990 RepID=A0A4V3D8F8_9ACTN|nr:hypothetical protein [Actinorugispora endophytica]TDQ51587.1 hypothetical protein EV190_11076 [Actinorugispora endophytica]
MSGTDQERETRLHQIVFRWTDHHLLGGRGIGPVGTSLDERGLAEWSALLDNGDLVSLVRRERPAVGLLRLRSRPDRAALVRVDTVPASVRGSHQTQVLLGRADVLTARLALELMGWSGWLRAEDGPLADPRLPAVEPDDLAGELRTPEHPDPAEVAALVRHVLRHPEENFHFAGARSDPYALAFGVAAVLDVSVMVEGDVRAAGARPQVVVTGEKVKLHASGWSKKTPDPARAPLAEHEADVAELVRTALAAAAGSPPLLSGDSMTSWIADLRFRERGLYQFLMDVLDGDPEAARHLAEADTLRWMRDGLGGLGLSELIRLCRDWGRWHRADARATALLRDHVVARALDWEEDRERDELCHEARRLFSPSTGIVPTPRREAEVKAVRSRLGELWRAAEGVRNESDAVLLLARAHTLAQFSPEEFQDVVDGLKVPASTLVVAANAFAGRHGAEGFRRSALTALRGYRASHEERPGIRAALVETDFLLDALRTEGMEERADVIENLLLCGYGGPEENKADGERPRQLYRDLSAILHKPGLAFVLPGAARVIGAPRVQLRLWRGLRDTRAAREADVLLDGVAEHVMAELPASPDLRAFRERLADLTDLLSADALPKDRFQRLCQDNAYFQEPMTGYHRGNSGRTRAADIIRAYADLFWLANGHPPDQDRTRCLPDPEVRALFKARSDGGSQYYLLAVIRVSRTVFEPTRLSEMLWEKVSDRAREKVRAEPELAALVGEPPLTNRDRRAETGGGPGRGVFRALGSLRSKENAPSREDAPGPENAPDSWFADYTAGSGAPAAAADRDPSAGWDQNMGLEGAGAEQDHQGARSPARTGGTESDRLGPWAREKSWMEKSAGEQWSENSRGLVIVTVLAVLVVVVVLAAWWILAVVRAPVPGPAEPSPAPAASRSAESDTSASPADDTNPRPSQSEETP